jgi:hypothetical protein
MGKVTEVADAKRRNEGLRLTLRSNCLGSEVLA